MSLVCIVLMIAFVSVRTLKLVSKNDPFFMSTDEIEDNLIDLWDLGFMFAIQDVSPQVGKVEAYHISWPSGG